MSDIRDVLKGLDAEDRALYQEVRTTMRRSYLAAHARLLPIEQYDFEDDAFLDLIDIKVAILFDRSGHFNHVEGHLDTEKAVSIEKDVKVTADSRATALMRRPLSQNDGWKQ